MEIVISQSKHWTFMPLNTIFHACVLAHINKAQFRSQAQKFAQRRGI
jgi:hypothetical protein